MAGKFFVERRTERWTLNVELNVERWTKKWKSLCQKNQWIETQGYGSTVYPLGFSEFLGGGVG